MPKRSHSLYSSTVVILAGPTGTGKSQCALEVAQKRGGAIINADSIQLYKELSVLTARPTDEDLLKAPHGLYGVLSGTDPSSVALWRQWASEEIHRAHTQGLIPLVVGGTGLYISALVEGLSEIPPIDPEIRAQLRRQLGCSLSDSETSQQNLGFPSQGSQSLSEQKERSSFSGLGRLYQRLQAQDPEMASRLKPRDHHRILRALEVVESTGKSLLFWQQKSKPALENWSFQTFIFLPDKKQLYDHVQQRFEEMVKKGGLEEVQGLLSKGYPASSPLMKALGVSEIQAYLCQKISYETMRDLGRRATRRYAKRQYTWFQRYAEKGSNFLKEESSFPLQSQRIHYAFNARGPFSYLCISEEA